MRKRTLKKTKNKKQILLKMRKDNDINRTKRIHTRPK